MVVLAAGAVVVVVVDSVVEELVADEESAVAGVAVTAEISAFACVGHMAVARNNVIPSAIVFMWCHLGEECLNIPHHNCWVGRFVMLITEKTVNRN